MMVKVTGLQWSWTFEYPAVNGVSVISDELHLPEGKQVLLRMTSNDVIHSFWVPEFRVKQDLVPGRITELRITPTLDGNYKVRCAELCGTSHAYMEKPVIVSSQADFDTWMTEQLKLAEQSLANPRRARTGAGGCKWLCGLSFDQWLGRGLVLPGSACLAHQVKLTDGSVVTADEAYITESIKAPQAKIVAGFETQLMPTYGFTDEQIDDIVVYIKTLK